MSNTSQIPKNSLKVFLSIFSGEEKEYVRQSERKARIILAIIGMFVILMFFGCIVSAYCFFNSLLENNYAVSIPVGIFWGLLVVNMYLLLLYTVSPSILPNKKNMAGTDNGLFTFSMLLRVGFMSLLAIITAQPLNVELFSDSITQSLNRHIQLEKAKMIISCDSYIIGQEMKSYQEFSQQFRLSANQNEQETLRLQIKDVALKIKTDISFLQSANATLKRLLKIEEKIFPSKKDLARQQKDLVLLDQMIGNEIQSDRDLLIAIQTLAIQNKGFITYKQQLASALTAKIKNYEDLDTLLSKTNFYIKRIQLIFYENPWSWLATGFICFLFILPIILKYRVRRVSNYYSDRIKMEISDVTNRYELFKKDYCNLLRSNISKYNFSSQKRLEAALLKLKAVNPNRYRKLRQEMKDEYQEEVFSKYEYWADNPFRTKPKKKVQLTTQMPISLMDFLYDNPQNDPSS